VGQSESWPEGQPEGRCGAWGRASQARFREALGFRPALERGSATVSWLDGDRRAARKRRAQGPLRGSAKSPEERTRVLRRRGGASEGRIFTTKARLSALRLPLFCSRARSPEPPTHVKRFAGSDDACPEKGTMWPCNEPLCRRSGTPNFRSSA
jgi:hypothetical protein